MIRELGLRRYVAWKLVQLAHLLHDAEHYERLYITAAGGGEIFSAEIVGDEYGCGIATLNNRHWGEVLPAGCRVHWDDDYKPDWLDE